MKKALIILLSLTLLLTLAACGGGEPTESNSAPAESGPTPSSGLDKETMEYGSEKGIKVYGIGETEEAEGLDLTIDKVETPDPDIFIYGPDDGFSYMQVYCTLKNITKETIQTSVYGGLLIVYEDARLYNDRKMKGDDGSDILPEYKEGMYRITELAPGESLSCWMMFQRPVDMQEITMHYYSKFVTHVPDIVFRFKVEEIAGNQAKEQKVEEAAGNQIPEQKAGEGAGNQAKEQKENNQVTGNTGLSLNEIAGVYNIVKIGTEESFQVEMLEAGDTLVVRFADGTEAEYEYDPIFGVASRFAEFEDGHKVLTIMTFTWEADTIRVDIDETITYADQSVKNGTYEGYKNE